MVNACTTHDILKEQDQVQVYNVVYEYLGTRRTKNNVINHNHNYYFHSRIIQEVAPFTHNRGEPAAPGHFTHHRALGSYSLRGPPAPRPVNGELRVYGWITTRMNEYHRVCAALED